MEKTLICADITNIEADALIYSTNVDFNFSGGVGGALTRKLGFKFQTNMVRLLQDTLPNQLASVGTILPARLPYSPWKTIYNTVVTSECCITKHETVEHVLSECLSDCHQDPSIQTVALSPLGAGFGDLSSKEFATLLNNRFQQETHTYSGIQKLSLVCNDPIQFTELKSYFETHHSMNWKVMKLESPTRFRHTVSF